LIWASIPGSDGISSFSVQCSLFLSASQKLRRGSISSCLLVSVPRDFNLSIFHAIFSPIFSLLFSCSLLRGTPFADSSYLKWISFGFHLPTVHPF
jgi:hypothetical protein